jgi:hypothetical protein
MNNNTIHVKHVQLTWCQDVQHTTCPNLVSTYKSHDVPDVQQLQYYNTKMYNMYNNPESTQTNPLQKSDMENMYNKQRWKHT